MAIDLFMTQPYLFMSFVLIGVSEFGLPAKRGYFQPAERMPPLTHIG